MHWVLGKLRGQTFDRRAARRSTLADLSVLTRLVLVTVAVVASSKTALAAPPTAAGEPVEVDASSAAEETGDTAAADNKAPDADSAAADLEPQVRRLVSQLDNAQLAVREQAEKQLIDLGPEALKWLPAPDDQTSAEMKHRLARIEQRLQRLAAERGVQHSVVTLHDDKMSLADVLAAFEKQTGNKLSLAAMGDEEAAQTFVSVDFDKTPFWKALDNVLDQSELTAYHYNFDQVVELRKANPGARQRSDSASYVGPFRIEPTEIVARRDLQSGRQSLRLAVEVAWEPRIAPIALKLPLSSLRATDGDGDKLDIADSDTVLPAEVQSGVSAVQFNVPLKPIDAEAGRIGRLRGTLLALVAGQAETFRFDDIEKAKETQQQRGGVVVILDDVRQNNDLWDVRVRVRFDEAAGALQSHRGWIYRNERHLIGADGKTIEELAMEVTGQSENEVGFTYVFDPPGGPQGKSFIYKTPVLFVELPIEFELKDVELP